MYRVTSFVLCNRNWSSTFKTGELTHLLMGTDSGPAKFFVGVDIVGKSRKCLFFKYSTHYLTRTLIQSWGQTHPTEKGMSRVQYAVLFFSVFTNIQLGGERTLIIITFEWISLHQVTLKSTFCLWWPLPSVSVSDTFSSIYSDLCLLQYE